MLRAAGKDASQVKALEVACGTGRFATFVKARPASSTTRPAPCLLKDLKSTWAPAPAANSSISQVPREECTHATHAEAGAALCCCCPLPHVQDNYPTLDLTLLDLSPYYLAAARSNMQ